VLYLSALGREIKVQPLCGHVVGSGCIRRWAAQKAHDPRCGVCRGILYDETSYGPDPCRPHLRAVKQSLDMFKTLEEEEVDDWLVMGVDQGEAHMQFDKLVGRLEICVLHVKEGLDELSAQAENCRPNFAVMEPRKIYEKVKQTAAS
jgi:hypothetical protein